MPQINFNLGQEEDDIVNTYSKKWEKSKPETITIIIKRFKELDANTR